MNMSMQGVIHHIGVTARKPELRNMVFALSLHPWNNSREDEERKRAAEHALRHWPAYQRECDLRRKAASSLVCAAARGVIDRDDAKKAARLLRGI